jgi:hypothetical protein
MKCFIKNPISSATLDSSELKALLFALFACFLFIGLLTAFRRPKEQRRVFFAVEHLDRAAPPPFRPAEAPPVTAELPPPPQPADLNARFRIAPRNFERIDFRNRSYGNYILSGGEVVDLALIDGQFRRYSSPQHWFDFSDIVYTDLTGDGSPEAIVLLSHLECGRACDGGRNLIYVYSLNHSTGYTEILKYETGSGLNGCSLKSLNVKNRRLSLELFGQCPQPKGTTNDQTRHETYDVTQIGFRFNGELLLAEKPAHLKLRDCNEVNWGVEIRIDDERTPAANTTLRRNSSGPCA